MFAPPALLSAYSKQKLEEKKYYKKIIKKKDFA